MSELVVRLNARIHNQREQISHGHHCARQLKARIAELEDALARHSYGPASFLRNSYVHARKGDETLFHGDSEKVTCALDGYAIIPIEQYHDLNGATGFAPENHWPCKACGAVEPTPEGHDPCIANLPGVIHACCGHGHGHAYAMFENGVILKGHFEDVRPPLGAASAIESAVPKGDAQ